MGLMGIHDLDILHCFNGVTHCPWYRRKGQNEGHSCLPQIKNCIRHLLEMLNFMKLKLKVKS